MLLSIIIQKNILVFLIIDANVEIFFIIHKLRGVGAYQGNENFTQKWLLCLAIWFYHDFWHILQ